jgi:FkbM family methyltransferase
LLTIENLAENFTHDNFFFVQVGANDGIVADPLKDILPKYDWKGLFVEPGKIPFQKLKELYKDSTNYMFENSAITEHDGTTKFYFVEGSDALSSLAKKSTGSIRTRRSQRRIKKMVVPCLTMKTLFQKHNIRDVDLLQIDVEGFDDMVIHETLKTNIKPRIIRYEHAHIPLERQEKLHKKLRFFGYKIITPSTEHDTVCIRLDC